MLQSRFGDWSSKKRLIDGYANSAKEFANAEFKTQVDSAESKYASVKTSHDHSLKIAESQYRAALELLKQQSNPPLRKLKADCSALFTRAGYSVLSWNAGKWNDWQPTATASFEACMGRLVVGPIKPAPTHGDLDIRFEVPAVVPFASGKEGKCLLFKSAGKAKEDTAKSAQSLIMRLRATTPPGKVKFTFIDPVGLDRTSAGLWNSLTSTTRWYLERLGRADAHRTATPGTN